MPTYLNGGTSTSLQALALLAVVVSDRAAHFMPLTSGLRVFMVGGVMGLCPQSLFLFRQNIQCDDHYFCVLLLYHTYGCSLEWRYRLGIIIWKKKWKFFLYGNVFRQQSSNFYFSVTSLLQTESISLMPIVIGQSNDPLSSLLTVHYAPGLVPGVFCTGRTSQNFHPVDTKTSRITDRYTLSTIDWPAWTRSLPRRVCP